MPNISQNVKGAKELKGKKILFVVTQTKWGGAQKYVLELAKHFQKNNQVHIAFGETKQINQKFLDICRTLHVKTIAIDSLVRSIDLAKDLSASLALAKIISHENYDIVHLNSSKVGLLGSLAKLFYNFNPMNARLRIVYTAHGFVFNEPSPKIQKFLFKASETFSTALQNLIITVSEFDKQSAIDLNIAPAGKMTSIHNGIDPKEYIFYDKDRARAELGLSADKKYFGTIASFYSTKGYTYLVEAVKQLRDNQSPLINNHAWIFIGEGPELSTIQKQIADSQLSDLIKIIKPQDDDWKFMKAFDYFVLPSIKEGLPYTLLEAGLAKVPIIASKVGGIPEIITDGKTGLLVTPANPLALSATMTKLALDLNLSQQLVADNYQNILANFNLQDTLQQTEVAYLKLF